jgi:hypothetical protein
VHVEAGARACDREGDGSGPSVDREFVIVQEREKLNFGSEGGKETRTVDEPLYSCQRRDGVESMVDVGFEGEGSTPDREVKVDWD